MVDEDFRARLDNFSEKLDKYSPAAVKLGSEIRKILMEETNRIFEMKVNQLPTAEVTCMKGYSRSSNIPDLAQCLVSETQPIEFTKKIDSDASGLELILTITSIDNKTSQIHNPSKFEEFWESCLRRMTENETYKFVKEENCKILEDARKVREEIIKRIEKPWKI